MNLTRSSDEHLPYIRERWYKQTKGAPIDSILSPILAKLFMEDLEVRTMQHA